MIPALVDTDMTLGRTESGMISPEHLVDETMHAMHHNREAINIERTQLSRVLHRIFPQIAY